MSGLSQSHDPSSRYGGLKSTKQAPKRLMTSAETVAIRLDAFILALHNGILNLSICYRCGVTSVLNLTWFCYSQLYKYVTGPIHELKDVFTSKK
jgi:hypothetical protein